MWVDRRTAGGATPSAGWWKGPLRSPHARPDTDEHCKEEAFRRVLVDARVFFQATLEMQHRAMERPSLRHLYLERCLSAQCLCLSLFSTGNYDRLARWARLTGKRFGHDDVEALPFMVSNIAHNPEFSKELSSIVLALFSGVRR